MKGYKALHVYYLNHFGHKFAKEQAATAKQYFLTRKMLKAWRGAFIKQINSKITIQTLNEKRNE
jgi:hypothetical protein